MGFLGTTDRGWRSELVPLSYIVIDLDKEQEFLSAATFWTFYSAIFDLDLILQESLVSTLCIIQVAAAGRRLLLSFCHWALFSIAEIDNPDTLVMEERERQTNQAFNL